MKLWLLLTLTFVVQEAVTANAVLLEAYQAHYNVWIIHALFVAATLFDIAVGYACGAYLEKRFRNSPRAIPHYLFKKSDEFARFVGNRGAKLSLFVYGPIIFPSSAAVAPWLGISFRDALPYLFFGNLLFWYGSEWLIVLGVKTFVPNPISALFYVIAITTIAALIVHRWWRVTKSR